MVLYVDISLKEYFSLWKMLNFSKEKGKTNLILRNIHGAAATVFRFVSAD